MLGTRVWNGIDMKRAVGRKRGSMRQWGNVNFIKLPYTREFTRSIKTPNFDSLLRRIAPHTERRRMRKMRKSPASLVSIILLGCLLFVYVCFSFLKLFWKFSVIFFIVNKNLLLIYVSKQQVALRSNDFSQKETKNGDSTVF